jgi:phosphoglycerate kinase
VPVPRAVGAISANLPRLDDLEVAGKRVLVRADLNVPLDRGDITDDFRIRAFLPTLERILERGGEAVVCSHLGRPAGPDPKFTLAPVAAALSDALAGDVPLVFDYEKVPEVRVSLLENLRFNEGETKNDAAFADLLSATSDAFVNDAFGACHRAHASIVGPPARLPAAAGLLVQREVENLSKLLGDPERPYVVVLGGVKVADKIGVVRNLASRADAILIGGAMCFTFLCASGWQVGDSIVDTERIDEVSDLLQAAPLMLPSDIVTATGIDAADGEVKSGAISVGQMGVDIGPETAAAFAAEISRARTVFWNGPMGVFEKDPFANGSRAVAAAVARSGGFTVTGGGDTAAVLAKFGLSGRIDFESTGGGASLEFLEGKTLPGLAALTKES